MVRKAVIPVAGLGTRMLPAAKAVPKEFLPVLDRPAVQYVVEECADAGVDDVLLVTGRDKRAIEDHFDRNAELEARLAAGGKLALLKTINELAARVKVHAVRQPEQRGLGMPSCRRAGTWVASRSSAFSATRSSAAARVGQCRRPSSPAPGANWARRSSAWN